MDYHQTVTQYSGGSPANIRQQTILLVDNDEINLKYMSEVLRTSGYGVAVFYDAPSALYFSTRGFRRFDLVITDYRLPGTNGLELIGALKSQHSDVPMVLLADQCDIDIYCKAFNPGIFEYINKPMNQPELLRIVREALRMGMPERVEDFRESLMAPVETYQNIRD